MRIAIEGNIGSGKSTLLENLCTLAPFALDVVPEKVSSWTLLKQFYVDRGLNALALQTQVLASYCHEDYDNTNIQKGGVMLIGSGQELVPMVNFKRPLIMERSAKSALGVFCKVFNEIDWLEEDGLFLLNNLDAELPIKRPDAFVYIKVPAKTCFERLNGAFSISLDYLLLLEAAYESFLKTLQTCGTRVEIVNGVGSPTEVYERALGAIVKITTS